MGRRPHERTGKQGQGKAEPGLGSEFREGGQVARFWAVFYELTCGLCYRLEEDCRCDDEGEP